MKNLMLATAAVLSVASTPVLAAGNSFTGMGRYHPDAGQAVLTSRGQVVTTGRVGNMQTTTMPGGAGQGLLMDNGNATSTLIGPGTVTTVLPTP